jgi:hypothetical protein
MHRKQFYLLLVSVLLLVGGCQDKNSIVDPATPLAVTGRNLQSISPGNIVLADGLRDTKVGYWHGGLIQIPNAVYAGDKALEASAQYPGDIATELRSAGYSVIEVNAAQTEHLFNDQTQGAADFQLAGTITNLVYDSYSSIAGDCSKADATIRWQLMDNRTKAIVFDRSTKGLGHGPSNQVSTIAYAVRGSLRQLLSDPDFSPCVTTK